MHLKPTRTSNLRYEREVNHNHNHNHNHSRTDRCRISLFWLHPFTGSRHVFRQLNLALTHFILMGWSDYWSCAELCKCVGADMQRSVIIMELGYQIEYEALFCAQWFGGFGLDITSATLPSPPNSCKSATHA
jgi:hypothetical protein